MERPASDRTRSRRAAVVATMVVFGLGLQLAAAPRLGGVRPQAAARSRTAGESQSANAGAVSNLVVVSTEVRDKTVRFGDELPVLVTLQNQGREPITIPAGALLLENTRQRSESKEGVWLGEAKLVRAGVYDKEEQIVLQPGESGTFVGNDWEVVAEKLGPQRAQFAIRTKNKTLLGELGEPPAFVVSYYVTPSKLLTAVWAARSIEERQRLQPQIRDLLLNSSDAEDPRDWVRARATLELLGGYQLPFLEAMVKDPDPVVRQRALSALFHSWWATAGLNGVLSDLIDKNEGRDWAASVGKLDENQVLRDSIRLEIAALGDADARVRITAISVLADRVARETSYRRSFANPQRNRQPMKEQEKRLYEGIGLADPAVPLIKKMAADADPGVRAEVQKFLSQMAAEPGVARDVVASLTDPDAGVRNQAIQALRSSEEPPPMAIIEKAFASSRGDVGLGLIELITEREDSGLAARLSPGFKERSAPERLMIMTAIAGHDDNAAQILIAAGLKDPDNDVRRVSLSRLLECPTARAMALIKGLPASSEEQQIRAAAEMELNSRELFPFLVRSDGSVTEKFFPSVQGTGPKVSPDGKWVAYTETGWGRHAGIGGLGRSNMVSNTHVARRDGYSDKAVSDMFLVGWMSDSRSLASSRDGFATITSLSGKIIAEFGDPIESPRSENRLSGLAKQEAGVVLLGERGMEHSKRFQTEGRDVMAMSRFDYGEDAAFSPDGRWFGPRLVNDQWEFVDAGGHKVDIKKPEAVLIYSWRAAWSSDGAHVVLIPVKASNSFGGDEKVSESRKAFVIDFAGQDVKAVLDVDGVPTMGEWEYRKGRWNPWSKDGKRLAFIRGGQVWTLDPDGGNARQMTFDGAHKAFPTFSPDGSKIAYITWQFDKRRRNAGLGPTDLWVVDCGSGLAARLTRPSPQRIEGLDWLDGTTLIYDRVQEGEWKSSLRTASLK